MKTYQGQCHECDWTGVQHIAEKQATEDAETHYTFSGKHFVTVATLSPPEDELTDAEFSGAVTDPILLMLQHHQWVGWSPGPLGFCLCAAGEKWTPHQYRLHVRELLLTALQPLNHWEHSE